MYFELGQILSVTTGRLLCEIDDLYDILNFMTGDNLMTHQLPRAMKECSPSILAQLPQLSDVTGEEITPENARDWLFYKTIEFGDKFELEPVNQEEYKHIDPIEEIVSMVGPEKVIVVDAKE